LIHFGKRMLCAILLGAALMLAFPLAAQAAAAISSFSMDRTTVQAGQSIVLTIQTSAETTHVFAELGGTRTQGTLSATGATGIRTWTVNVPATAGANRVNVYANTSNTTVNAVTLAIPITVTAGAGTTLPGGGGQGPLAIHSVTEIQAQGVNQVRLEIVTGPGANDVWVRHSGGRYVLANRVSGDANSRTWHLSFVPSPANQTVQVYSNTGYWTRGAQSRSHTITHAAPFVAPATPMIMNATANPTRINMGGTSNITIQTNADVNYVWMMVNNVRVNATRTTSVTPLIHNWTAPVSPNATGNITIHANATNTVTGAFTRDVSVEVLLTQAVIASATVSWITAADATNQDVRVTVYTNRYTRGVWVNLPGIGLREVTLNHSPLGTGNVRWQAEIRVPANWRNTSATLPIHIHASEFTTMGGGIHDATVTISGVGGHWWHGQGGTQHGHGLAWNIRTNPTGVFRTMPVLDTVEFTTSNDIIEVRVRDAGGTLAQTVFEEGAVANTRVWTLRNIWLHIPADTNNVNLIVEVRRATGGWLAAPHVNIPVW